MTTQPTSRVASHRHNAKDPLAASHTHDFDVTNLAVTTDLTAETTNRTSADMALQNAIADINTRVTALNAAVEDHDARIYALEHPVVVVPPPTQKVVTFAAGGTTAQFVALCQDNTIDVIEIAGGTYPAWACFLDVARTRPLLVRPKGDVVWDGTGTSNTPPFRVGWSALASGITFDPSGTGTFTIANYRIGKAGLIMVRYGQDIAFNGIRVRNSYGDPAIDPTLGQQHAHSVYVSTDGTHRSSNLTFNGWDVVGPTNRYLNGLQTDGATSVDGLTAKGWIVSSLHRAVYAWSNPTAVTIDGWSITGCDATIDNNSGQQLSQGVVKNCTAVNAGPLANGQGSWGGTRLVDGGGNTSSATPPPLPPITGGATPNIPSSIDPTGQTDVTGPLQSWLSGLPTGATAVMGNGATYLVNGTVHLSGRSPLTIDWNGSGWVQKVRSATRIFLVDGGGSGIRLLTPKITGANPNPGKWDPAWENNHAIQVGGVDGIDIVQAQLTNVCGDGIYLSGGANKWAKRVNVLQPVIDGIGRMGISFTDGVSGFLIDAAKFARIGYYTIDFEPNGATVEGRAAGAENGVIRNCVASVKPYGDYFRDKTQANGYYLVFTGASGGGPANNIECYGCRSDDPTPGLTDFRWNNFLGGSVNVHDNVRQVQS